MLSLNYRFTTILVLSLTILSSLQIICQHRLEEIFGNPPDEAKPRTYWLWAHGNFDYIRIQEELKAINDMGLGGADIFDMGLADPYQVIPAGNKFMSEEMVDGIAFALNEAKKLNLKMGLSVSNGWNAGGDWTKDHEKLMRLLFWQDTVSGPAEIAHIGFPEVPTTFEKPYGQYELFPQFLENGFPVYYKDVSLVAFPYSDDHYVKELNEIIYFQPGEIKGNIVNLKLPAGKWVIVRAVVTPLGQKMWMRSDRSNGYIMDHYAKNSTKNHFNYIIQKLEDRIGDLGKSALERLYLASFEAEDYVIWSPDLQNEFFDQHGYRMDAYLPIFSGQIIVDQETTDRFLHDYRVTVSEMFINNHYRQASRICRANGLLLASESGGPGPPLHYVPTEDLKALGSVDIMRGEFWNRKAQYFDENGNDLTQVVKNIGSAAHIYGHKIVEMEAFTSHGKHWQERPIELKKLADKAFCEGMTRVIYHTMTHSPKEAGYPGWSYSAGTHISPKMSWWSLSKPFHAYLARTSAMLQQGLYVADVAYYYGEQIPNFASGSKYIRKSLGAGYAYDDLNKEILLKSTVTGDGQLMLPSGMKYRLLVLPDDPQMSLEVVSKVEELLKAGATILGKKPSTVPGLKDYKEREAELRSITDKVWSSPSDKQRISYGAGMLYTGHTEQAVLTERGILPDFTYDTTAVEGMKLDYIHRATSNEDIYFVRNEDSAWVHTVANFRTNNAQPYSYNPKNGMIRKIAYFDSGIGTTELPISLEPLGSMIIVFVKDQSPDRHVVLVEPSENSRINGSTGEVFYGPANQLVFRHYYPGRYRVTFSDGSIDDINIEPDETISIDNDWDVRFPHGWGFEPIQHFNKLTDWVNHENKNLANYSGVATYKTTFKLDKDLFGSSKEWLLDLGSVCEVARVFINGSEVGAGVFPPYNFDVSGFIRPGDNFLSIEVANTWLNQLVADSKLPFNQQMTRSNVGRGTRNEPIRLWQDYSAMPSGLLGPVNIIVKHTLNFKN